MQVIALSLCMLAAVAAAPASDPNVVQYYSENDGSGNYRFGFKLLDGTLREEMGELVNRGLENEHISVQGMYQWVGPDSLLYTVKYKADDKGYHAFTTIEKDPEEDGPVHGLGLPAGVVASLLG